jgi:hypothetical protein
MRMLFPNVRVTTAERRLVFMAPPGPPESEVTPLANELSPDAKNQLEGLDATKRAEIGAAKRVNGAGVNFNNLKLNFENVLTTQYKHLVAPAPGRALAQPAAITDMQQTLDRNGFDFVHIDRIDTLPTPPAVAPNNVLVVVSYTPRNTEVLRRGAVGLALLSSIDVARMNPAPDIAGVNAGTVYLYTEAPGVIARFKFEGGKWKVEKAGGVYIDTYEPAGNGALFVAPPALTADQTKVNDFIKRMLDTNGLTAPAAPAPGPGVRIELSADARDRIGGAADVINALRAGNPNFANALAAQINLSNLALLKPEFEAFAPKFMTLDAAGQTMLLRKLFGPEPGALTPAVQEVFALTQTPQMRGMMETIKTQINIAGGLGAPPPAPGSPEEAEVLGKAKDILRDAQTNYNSATVAERFFKREVAIGKLMMLGVNVGGLDSDDGFPRANPDTLTMMPVGEKWEMILNKFMGIVRIASAYFAKIKGKLPGGANAPGAAPEAAPNQPSFTMTPEITAATPEPITLNIALQNIPRAQAIAAAKEALPAADQGKVKEQPAPATGIVIEGTPPAPGITRAQAEAVRTKLSALRDSLRPPAAPAPGPGGAPGAAPTTEPSAPEALNVDTINTNKTLSDRLSKAWDDGDKAQPHPIAVTKLDAIIAANETELRYLSTLENPAAVAAPVETLPAVGGAVNRMAALRAVLPTWIYKRAERKALALRDTTVTAANAVTAAVGNPAKATATEALVTAKKAELGYLRTTALNVALDADATYKPADRITDLEREIAADSSEITRLKGTDMMTPEKTAERTAAQTATEAVKTAMNTATAAPSVDYPAHVTAINTFLEKARAEADLLRLVLAPRPAPIQARLDGLVTDIASAILKKDVAFAKQLQKASDNALTGLAAARAPGKPKAELAAALEASIRANNAELANLESNWGVARTADDVAALGYVRADRMKDLRLAVADYRKERNIALRP